MQKIQPREIRILVEGGSIQRIGVGKDIPRDIAITLNDFDLDMGNDASTAEDNGYGFLAHCQILHDLAEEFPHENRDEDGNVWI